MPVNNTYDINELKNKDKRKKRLRNFLVFIIIAVIVAVLYATYEKWNPKIRDIGEQKQTIVNDGQLADGNFPVTMNGGGSFQFQYTEKYPVVLSDAYIYFYNDDGVLLKRRQHTYSDAVLQTNGGKALIFENGGKRFSVEDEDTVIYDGVFENNIVFARISSQGYCAVVTTSQNYDCEVIVYNTEGNVIYDRKSMGKVSDISFNSDSSGCMMSYLLAENGEFVTKVQNIDFSKKEEIWNSPMFNTFGLNVFGFSDGAFVLGMDSCGYIDGNGKITSYYSYDGELAGGDSFNGQSAVIVNNYDRRKYTAVLFSGNGKEPVKIESEQPLTDVEVVDGLAYVMNQTSLKAYDFEGNLHSTVQISDSYNEFVRSEKYIFLKGYNKIDRIDYDV